MWVRDPLDSERSRALRSEELATIVCCDAFENGAEGLRSHLPLNAVDRSDNGLLRPVLELADDLLAGEGEQDGRSLALSANDQVDFPVPDLLEVLRLPAGGRLCRGRDPQRARCRNRDLRPFLHWRFSHSDSLVTPGTFCASIRL